MKKIFLVVMIIFLFLGCSKKEDEHIKVGLVIGLNGKYSSLGKSISDGVILAFDEIDYKIDGKPVELIQKDDKQDIATDKKVINELLKDNVKIIIGNATSSMTKVSLEIINKYKDRLLFSPTASSSEFYNLDDNLIRINGGDTRIMLDDFINFIKSNNYKNIVIIGDTKNKSFLKSYTKLLPKYLKDENIVSNKIPFIDSNLKLEEIYKKLNQIKNIDMILIVANGIDTASIIQYLKYNNLKTPIVCSGWANDRLFFENIGKNTENIFFVSSEEKLLRSSKQYIEFENDFLKMYGKQPDKFNIKGYKAAQILIEAIKNVDDLSEVKKFILNKKTFDTVTGKVTFTKFGDVQYKSYMFKLENDKLKRIK